MYNKFGEVVQTCLGLISRELELIWRFTYDSAAKPEFFTSTYLSRLMDACNLEDRNSEVSLFLQNDNTEIKLHSLFELIFSRDISAGLLLLKPLPRNFRTDKNTTSHLRVDIIKDE